MDNLDIFSIDIKIRLQFEEEGKKINEYHNTLKELINSLENNNKDLRQKVKKTLSSAIEDLSKYIKDIENNTKLNFYFVETAELLEEYNKILKTPLKVSFIGKPTYNNSEKLEIETQYLKIASKYINISIDLPDKSKLICCTNCPNKKDFNIIDENIYVCEECSAQQIVIKQTSSYNDIDRVNISSKYMYDRKVHFRDCINQYQGKQNSTIPQKIYDDLEDQFEKHHLLIGDKDTHKITRFQNITKEHISMFLRELDYNKHYENVHLIHYNMTSIKPDDISYLEDKLLDDFDNLTALYDKMFKHINRKNFINTQYVLFQLLKRHKHPCNKEDFSILKTIDRKSFHDDVSRVLFENLGYNHHPLM